jgi:hypothetical protein
MVEKRASERAPDHSTDVLSSQQSILRATGLSTRQFVKCPRANIKGKQGERCKMG